MARGCSAPLRAALQAAGGWWAWAWALLLAAPGTHWMTKENIPPFGFASNFNCYRWSAEAVVR